jgi:hypothetical protein
MDLILAITDDSLDEYPMDGCDKGLVEENKMNDNRICCHMIL